MNCMIALDTNVLIYACDKSDARKQSVSLGLISDKKDTVLLWQVACEFIAASRKLAPQGFTVQHAWARLSEFLDLFPLVLPSQQMLGRAGELHLAHGWSFWDAMIVAGCQECGADRLYSEDIPGGRIPIELEIINPFA
jgi:predicted nucleic acid-binding protein